VVNESVEGNGGVWGAGLIEAGELRGIKQRNKLSVCMRVSGHLCMCMCMYDCNVIGFKLRHSHTHTHTRTYSLRFT